MPDEKPAYRVEADTEKACAMCGHGTEYSVVGPDDVAIGTTFDEKDEAEDVAYDLSEAYKLGLAAKG